jgi:sulfatase maturation enzyme AslB (radical SAM superfamily)
MPWINLATETNGKCKICCVVMTNRYVKKDDGTDYLIHKDRLRDIYNSTYIKDVRKKMLAGEWAADCFYCQNVESSGSDSSPRVDYNQRWLDEDTAQAVTQSARHDGHVERLPVSLEPRPGITCNLKCTTCWSLSSSKIYLERQQALAGKFGPMPEFLRQSWSYEIEEAAKADFEWSDHEIYLQNMRECLPDLKRLYFTGGEPALIRSNWTLVEELAEQGRTDVLVAYTTNLTHINEKHLELLRRFERVEITVSLDGLGEVNDYIRFPSRTKQVIENIFLLHARGFSLAVMSVVQVCNIFSYLDLLRWLALDTPLQQALVIPTLLQGPDYLRLEILPQSLKERAFAEIDEILADERIPQFNRQRLGDIREHMRLENPKAEMLRDQLQQTMAFLDKLRGTNFQHTFPDLAHALRKD